MIYFDNFATTKVDDDVLFEIIKSMQENIANVSSIHRLGYLAEQKVVKAKRLISETINVQENELYFTSGATESNNIAIFGVCEAYKRNGNKVITTKIEHSSVKKCFEQLENRGFDVCYLDVDEKGYINIDNLIREIDEHTIFVSIMYVNNEIGTIQHIDEIAQKIKQKNKNVIFHTDVVQAFGKMKINLKNIDLFSMSGHKIHAQKGIGMLYVKSGTKIYPLMFGAGQQGKIRSGTINTEGIIGLAKATQIAYANIDKNMEHIKNVKNEIINLKHLMCGVSINGDEKNASPYVVNISFDGVMGEVLVHSLEQKEIYVSTGSACNSKGKESSTLYYTNINNAKSSIRVSLSCNNTIEEATIFNKEILEIIPMLRMFKHR